MSKRGESLAIFISGIIVGGIIGVLYAPGKGSNTREKLSFKLKKYREKLESLLEGLISNREGSLTGGIKSKGDQIVSATRAKAEQLLEDVDSMITQIRKE